MSPQDVLIKAAELIEAHGWQQADGRGPNGEVCAVEAIAEFEPFSYCTESRAHALLAQYLGVDLVADWNDAEGRTKEQVIAALRAAAQKVE